MERIRIGISSCLLGNQVRYDGGHARARHLTGTLADYLEFHPVCPEVGCGMDTPREAVRLVGDVDNPRLVGRQSGTDWTETMRSWAENELGELEKLDLCGFIFKSKSPSSGMTRIKVYAEDGGQPISHEGVGIFAAMFMERFPLLPVEDEGRLHDVVLRGNFIERVFVQKRWNDMAADNKTMGGLVDFHTRHKMLIHSHDQVGYREMGRLVAEGKQLGIDTLFRLYQQRLARALSLKPTARKNADVLMHIMGHFKKLLSGDEKQECLEMIDNYKNSLIPLIVPVTLMNHYVRKYDVDYLRDQFYLHPHPLELKLRNNA